MSRLHPLSDPYIAAFIVISRLKSYAEPRIDVIPAILRQNLLPGPQIAVFLRKTRLKRAVNSQTDLYLPISRLELPSRLQRPAMHDERPVLQQKCPFALQMNEKNPDLQQRQPSLLQNARPNLNICVTYSARPTRHDKRDGDGKSRSDLEQRRKS